MYDEFSDQIKSPGGFIFGVQGWMWGPPKPTCITFFVDDTAKVSDQYGRPIRGAVIDGKEVRFVDRPPELDDGGNPKPRKGKFATHAEVIRALEVEKVDWQTLTYAGFPQLPYSELKKIKHLPPTPTEELLKIPNRALRRDALRIRKETNELIDKEREEAGLLPQGYED